MNPERPAGELVEVEPLLDAYARRIGLQPRDTLYIRMLLARAHADGAAAERAGWVRRLAEQSSSCFDTREGPLFTALTPDEQATCERLRRELP